MEVQFSRKSERIAGTALINGLILSFSRKQQSKSDWPYNCPEHVKNVPHHGRELDDLYGPFSPSILCLYNIRYNGSLKRTA